MPGQVREITEQGRAEALALKHGAACCAGGTVLAPTHQHRGAGPLDARDEWRMEVLASTPAESSLRWNSRWTERCTAAPREPRAAREGTTPSNVVLTARRTCPRRRDRYPSALHDGAQLCRDTMFAITPAMPECPYCKRNNFRGKSSLDSHLPKCPKRKERRAAGSASAAQALQQQAMTHAQLAAQAAAAEEVAADFEMRIDEPPRPPSPIPLRASGLPNRRRKPTQKILDMLPQPPPPVVIQTPEHEPQPDSAPDPAPERVRRWVKSKPNVHGVYKVYPNRPSHDPDKSIRLEDLCQAPELVAAETPTMAKPDPPWYHPFPNPSIAHVMMWKNLTDNANSDAATDGVVDIFLRDDVNKKDLAGFSSKRENDRLDKFVDTPSGEPPNGWQRGVVKLKLPCVGVCTAEEDAFEIEIDGIYYRPLLDTLKEALQSPDFNNFHLTPFEPRCNPNYDPCRPQDDLDDDTTELDEHGLPPLPPGHLRLYAEAYTSPRMLKAYKAFEKLPPSKIERVRVAYMFFSDATHLASFGDASIWPLYTFFGNFPKDLRAKPTENLAYHQVWDMLLDDEFVKTCEEELEIMCYDKIPWQFLPWIYLYGADYPEKILLATICNMGGRPCPRCLILKSQIAETGTKRDMQRRAKVWEVDAWWISQVNKSREAIFDRGLGVNSTFVEQLLKENSWIPTKNVFAKMADVALGLNLFSLFIPDVLHEVEIGVVKAVFIHIVRLLYAHGASAVNKLDERFRQVPTFGRATIRKFHRNISEMKQFAARDHEDTFQCQIPVLEGLYPALEKLLLDTSFDLAAFHGMAKLRLHTSKTLTDFRSITTIIHVADICHGVCHGVAQMPLFLY
ncbi:hypothetical protein GGX14DRAFT_638737 [Mycena pura]|uniref:Uncharacterized protein n=1 Tax=Mycena pura TaxID=153505 RepID=A0AAD7E3A7_9AGAR|nr:hypothetical protein GGX14DRAFT_638737 [Mycena pura]